MNTSVNLVYVTLEVSGYVGAVVMAPDTANFSDAYTEAETYCSVSSLGVIAQAIAAAAPGYPSSEDPFFERITIPVPPGAGDKVFCEHRVWTISWFSTEESYDAAVTALDVPESLEVPPPRRQRFSVDVMNQGLEDIAGAVHLVASEGRPDRYMLPFDVLEPGELITLTSSSLWRPSMRADTVEWTATVELDDEYPDDEYPDNDVMTAETEMIRVRP